MSAIICTSTIDNGSNIEKENVSILIASFFERPDLLVEELRVVIEVICCSVGDDQTDVRAGRSVARLADDVIRHYFHGSAGVR